MNDEDRRRLIEESRRMAASARAEAAELQERADRLRAAAKLFDEGADALDESVALLAAAAVPTEYRQRTGEPAGNLDCPLAGCTFGQTTEGGLLSHIGTRHRELAGKDRVHRTRRAQVVELAVAGAHKASEVVAASTVEVLSDNLRASLTRTEASASLDLRCPPVPGEPPGEVCAYATDDPEQLDRHLRRKHVLAAGDDPTDVEFRADLVRQAQAAAGRAVTFGLGAA